MRQGREIFYKNVEKYFTELKVSQKNYLQNRVRRCWGRYYPNCNIITILLTGERNSGNSQVKSMVVKNFATFGKVKPQIIQ
jgi:hypothetical protein